MLVEGLRTAKALVVQNPMSTCPAEIGALAVGIRDVAVFDIKTTINAWLIWPRAAAIGHSCHIVAMLFHQRTLRYTAAAAKSTQADQQYDKAHKRPAAAALWLAQLGACLKYIRNPHDAD